jgi:ABC-type transporter Mla subunit MlaD
MTPGDPTTGLLPDGGHLRRASITPSIELDQIISTFDAPTRRAFQVWMQEQALATAGRGKDISDTIAQFGPLEEQATELLKLLDEQAPQLTQLISGTGQVFSALSARDGQLTSLIRNSNTVFTTIGRRNREFAEIWVALPTFQRETRRLLATLHGFVDRTDPLVTQLTPAFHELSRTLVATEKLSPDLLALVTGLGTAQTAGAKGLPAVDAFLGDLAPFLGALEPSLSNLNPFLQFVGAYPNDLASFFANSVAATNQRLPDTADPRGFSNILRAMNPLNPETLAPYPDRLKMNRPNAYYFPRATLKLNDLLKPSGGPPVYHSPQCTTGLSPVLSPSTPALIGQELTDRINKFIFGGNPADVPAPRCIQQGKFTAGGRTTTYPQNAQGVSPPPLTFGP